MDPKSVVSVAASRIGDPLNPQKIDPENGLNALSKSFLASAAATLCIATVGPTTHSITNCDNQKSRDVLYCYAEPSKSYHYSECHYAERRYDKFSLAP